LKDGKLDTVCAKIEDTYIHQIKPAENSYSARTTSSRDSDNSRLVGRPAGQKVKRRQVLEGNDGSIMYPQSFADPAGDNSQQTKPFVSQTGRDELKTTASNVDASFKVKTVDTHTQLAPRVRVAKAVPNVVSNGDLIRPQGEKRRTIRYPVQAATTTGSRSQGPLIDKKGITSPVETNTLDQSRIRSLLIKGFTIDEVKKMTKLDAKQIKSIAETVQGSDINQGSIDLYTELQRDLSKLVLLETQEGQKRDTNAILSAIKLQAELQEKKLQLDANMKGKSFSPTKVSKDYINTRDKEILEMEQGGMDYKKIAQVTGMSESSVNQALDRAKLELPDDLLGINPSIITETRGLSQEVRIDILRQAKQDGLNRNQVRSLVNQFKNESR
jgi:hypothetical protein